MDKIEQKVTQIEFNQLINAKAETFVINQFDEKYLQNIADSTKDHIVQFDLSSNKSTNVYKPIIEFMAKNSKYWRGLEMNFLFQNNNISPLQWDNISESIQFMSNLESVGVSMGGVYVSRSYAENHSGAYLSFTKVSSGRQFGSQYVQGLLKQFERIVANSPNLKRIQIDFQGLGQNSNYLLPILSQMNDNLEKCHELQEYVLSMNHVRIFDEKGYLTKFLDSFISLKSKKELKKFIMNVTEWSFNYNNFCQLSLLFGDFLTSNKSQFEEFEFDHSFRQSILPFVDEQENNSGILNEIQLFQRSFSQFLNHHKDHLKKFYLSLVCYESTDLEVIEFSKLFKQISKCAILERLSLRIQDWKCRNVEVERKFYQDLLQIANCQNLKLFHLTTFKSLINNNCYEKSQIFFKYLGQRALSNYKALLSLKAISSCKLQEIYRKDIIVQMARVCTYQEIQMKNTNFSLALRI